MSAKALAAGAAAGTGSSLDSDHSEPVDFPSSMLPPSRAVMAFAVVMCVVFVSVNLAVMSTGVSLREAGGYLRSFLPSYTSWIGVPPFFLS